MYHRTQFSSFEIGPDNSPYSLDLSPCSYFLHPKLKMKIEGLRFHTILRTRSLQPRPLPPSQSSIISGASKSFLIAVRIEFLCKECISNNYKRNIVIMFRFNKISRPFRKYCVFSYSLRSIPPS